MNILRIIVLMIFPIIGISQAPQTINFQRVLRNTNGEVVSNKAVSLRISILEGTITGPAVYVETHTRTSDVGGLISFQIGGGTVISGLFGNINWGNSAHFIQLEADFSGGNSYVLLGTQELMSVPYALYASKTDTSVLNLTTRLALELNETDTSLLNLTTRFLTKLDISDFPVGSANGNIMFFNGTSWVILAPGNEGEVLKISSGLPVWGTIGVSVFTCGTTISDIDGNSYNTVLIGAQCWTKENLRVRRYNNGTAMLFDTTGGSGGSSSTWQNLTRGAHTIYAHDSTATTPSNLSKYGYLYNWYAVKGISTAGVIAMNDTVNICPMDWHVPTDGEWTSLIQFLVPTETLSAGPIQSTTAGGKMKDTITALWYPPNNGATNESGFSALPGGFRFNVGNFVDISSSTIFWSATEIYNDFALFRYLNTSSGNVGRDPNYKSVGAYVRCLRN